MSNRIIHLLRWVLNSFVQPTHSGVPLLLLFRVYLQNQYGQPFPVKVTAKDETNITFDANHEMVGKELNFEIELVEVK